MKCENPVIKTANTYVNSSNVILIGFPQLPHDLHFSPTTGLDTPFHYNGSLWIINS